MKRLLLSAVLVLGLTSVASARWPAGHSTGAYTPYNAAGFYYPPVFGGYTNYGYGYVPTYGGFGYGYPAYGYGAGMGSYNAYGGFNSYGAYGGVNATGFGCGAF
ncbi:MAG: hypothetical protein ACREHD_04745 [Pirellulales bacterium]